MLYAGVMELADVLDSKSSGSDTVSVRPRPPAPKKESERKSVPIPFLSPVDPKPNKARRRRIKHGVSRALGKSRRAFGRVAFLTPRSGVFSTSDRLLFGHFHNPSSSRVSCSFKRRFSSAICFFTSFSITSEA